MAGLTVEVKPEGKCPPALVAREELKQVLLSIVLNAMQAVQEGGKLVIRIGAREGIGQSDFRGQPYWCAIARRRSGGLYRIGRQRSGHERGGTSACF